MAVPDHLLLRQGIVLGSAVIYWGGVFLQARRVRKQIGRSANIKPRGTKERLLWTGWTSVVLAWLVHPFLAGHGAIAWLPRSEPLWQTAGLTIGLGLVCLGYAGTLWCYAAMGSSWRIGINRKEKNSLITRGPYGHVRHPIYLFQMVMLLGAALLLPTYLALVILGVHSLCAWLKAADEESYLAEVHGHRYAEYMSQTGRFFPRHFRSKQ